VPVPRQRNVRTPSHPRPDAQSENEGACIVAVAAVPLNAVVMGKIWALHKMNFLQ